jgi:glutathione synthase/RimK-type ligase-like ATP-grasp enzyme
MGSRHHLIAIISNSSDATADYFERFIVENGEPLVRIDTDRFAQSDLNFHLVDGHVSSCCFATDGQTHRFEEISAIYYRRPRPPKLPDHLSPEVRRWAESEYRRAWGGLLHGAAGAKWVNHPLANSSASYKPEQLLRALKMGLSVPDSLITNNENAARRFCEGLNWDVVAKPLGYGDIGGTDPTGEDVVYTNLLNPSLDSDLALVANCPTMFQKHISKQLDVRVTIAGEQCIAVALHSQDNPISAVDCRRNEMREMRYSATELPTTISDSLVRLTRSYGLHFAAIDLALDRVGSYWFLELNPSGQWAWLEQTIGVPISAALFECLRSH